VPLEYVFDKPSAHIGVKARALIAQHHQVHHRQGRHQFRPRALAKQWLRRICHFHQQQPPWLPCLGQPPDMFRQQRIEMTGYPRWYPVLKPLVEFVERDYLCSCVQKQSLTVTSS
jgi:hypothetical protein